ncbi:hypothetical protein M407DRAFT_10170 [Tulasnella calospora MUT 4182]|uniref:Uncharacterized protein n=1 Tax=Tulasnella calospora MUT 4182 TaxID=1051891 RepID=A0A0C3Q1B0_9AGAM|nr:hypothetical protein M407DRAFT_10170 [Tulasnella calospora MUT 4182]
MENEPPPLNPRVDAPTHNPTFNGVDGIGYSEFIQAVRQHAFDNGKSRDNAWIADTAALLFSGPALDWYANTGAEENGTSNGFVFSGDSHVGAERLVQTIRRQAFATGTMNDDWWMADLASTVKLAVPLSEEEWLQQGRARRARITDPGSVSAMWYLVEVDEQIPPNAIPTGHENGSHLFCIRTWHQGDSRLASTDVSTNRDPLRGTDKSTFAMFLTKFSSATPTQSVGSLQVLDRLWAIARKAFSSQLQAYIGWSWREHQRGVSDVKILAWVDSSIP